MKGLVAVAVFAVAVTAGCAGPPLQPSPELTARRLSQGAWLITHEVPYPSNSLLVEMEDGTLVLVRTPYTERETHALVMWAYRLFGPRRIVAINTHFHWDSLGGNQTLVNLDIPIHGSDRTVELLRDRGESMRALILDWLKDRPEIQERFREPVLVPPTHVFPLAEGKTLRFGSEEVRILYPGPAHAPDNVVVYFPRRKLLHGGCMILAGDRVGNRSDADLKAWPEAIRRLQELDVEILVPGHGALGTADLLRRTLRVLERP